jgi:YVTN family beta-propeller protein
VLASAPDSTQRMEFRILGSFEVVVGGRQLPLAGAQQRALLVLLLLNANAAISTERLVDQIWGERPPATAAKTVQVYVSQLRKVLGDGRLETRGHGYSLRVDPGELDAEQFEALCSRAAGSNPAGAAALLRQALALFRGDPLSDVSYEPFATAEITRLEELRLHALEERVEADLGLGRHRALVPELEALVERYPLRDRLRGQLMLAFYQSGRQADALEKYREGRVLLDQELGLEPSPALRELQAAILLHDPALTAPRAPPQDRLRKRRRGLLLVVAGSVLLIAAAVAAAVIELLSPSHTPPVMVGDALVRNDARTNDVVGVTPVGRQPLAVAVSRRYLWALNFRDETVSRIDRTSGSIQTIGGLSAPQSIALGPGSTLWVGSASANYVDGFDIESLRFTERIPVPGTSTAFIAVSGNTLWVSQPVLGDAPGTVSRVSLTMRRVVRRYVLGGYTVEIAVGNGAAWVGVGSIDIGGEQTLARIPTNGPSPQRTAVGRRPSSPALGFGSVWVACLDDDKVWRVNATSGRVESIIDVGRRPFGVAVGRDAVWVTNQGAATVSRIDPRTNTVVRTIALGFYPQGITAVGDDVWVAVAGEDEGYG